MLGKKNKVKEEMKAPTAPKEDKEEPKQDLFDELNKMSSTTPKEETGKSYSYSEASCEQIIPSVANVELIKVSICKGLTLNADEDAITAMPRVAKKTLTTFLEETLKLLSKESKK